LTLFAWLGEVINPSDLAKLAKLAFLTRQFALTNIAVLAPLGWLVRADLGGVATGFLVILAGNLFVYLLSVCVSLSLSIILVYHCISV
jgi:hypothetical protein